MNHQTILNHLKSILILATCSYCHPGHSDTRSYAATTDFPVTDAGLVPYYSEAPGRPSLAINAADETYRDLFARAEVVYDGVEGLHDLTIVALAELDGEAEYRLLVNGELVGSATNPEVTVDYTVIRHTFTDINIPNGAVLGVESLANTNGNIPEGEGTAFARGRWTTLELVDSSAEADSVVHTPTDIDLTLLLTSDKQSLNQTEAFQIEMTISNTEESITATQPHVDILLPPQVVSLVSVDQCVETAVGLNCAFPEIPAGTSQLLSLSLMSTDEVLNMEVQAFVSADQDDRNEANNMANLNFTVHDNEASPDEGPDSGQSVLPETPMQPTAMSGSSSGGISLYWLLLLILSMSRQSRIKRAE